MWRRSENLARAIVLGLLLSGPSAQAGIDEPFGLAAVDVTDGPLRTTWQNLQAKMQSEKRIVSQCKARPESCASLAAQRFIEIVKEGDRQEGLARIGRINRAVNFAIAAVNAPAVQTEWTSPLESLAAGAGDCKQFTVLKYAALVDAGLSLDDLRVVIVNIVRRETPDTPQAIHAVVAVRDKAQWYILDNRSLAVVESGNLTDYYRPLFALDHRGVRQFVQPSGPVAAIAACEVGAG